MTESRPTDVKFEAIATCALERAKKHLGKGEMASSAQVAYDDAESLWLNDCYEYAAQRALDSIAYSVGAGNADWQEIKRYVGYLTQRSLSV